MNLRCILKIFTASLTTLNCSQINITVLFFGGNGVPETDFINYFSLELIIALFSLFEKGWLYDQFFICHV